MGDGDLSAGEARGAYVCALILGKEINEVECSVGAVDGGDGGRRHN